MTDINVVYDARMHNETEQKWCAATATALSNLIKRHELKVSDIRFARKSKAWGSSGVASYHLYTYGSGKVECWVNLDDCSLDASAIIFLLRNLLIDARRCEFRFNGVECDFRQSDVTSHYGNNPDNLPDGFKLTKLVRQHLAAARWAKERMIVDKGLVEETPRTAAEVFGKCTAAAKPHYKLVNGVPERV